MVGKGEDWKAYRGSRDSLSLVAFYADCQHEVLKVRSGYRITLTYNLMLRGDTSPRQEGDAGTVAELADLLREHFCTPAAHSWGQRRADPPSRLVYLLDHEYTPRALKWTQMKGADARRVPLLREAAVMGTGLHLAAEPDRVYGRSTTGTSPSPSARGLKPPADPPSSPEALPPHQFNPARQRPCLQHKFRAFTDLRSDWSKPIPDWSRP
jgi:hypothetical protein